MGERAIRVLKEVDCVFAEDTRHSRKLLDHFAIGSKLRSLHSHNERERASEMLSRLEAGQNLALISDAGTPLISDPGFVLVRSARRAGLRVIPIPGPNAAIAALSVSGIPADRFLFVGFLPAKSQARRQKLREYVEYPFCLIFYESPHRLAAMLQDMADIFPLHREAFLAREMTKHYEEYRLSTVGELAGSVAGTARACRGECVVIVAGQGQGEREAGHDVEQDRVLKLLLARLPVKEAAALAAVITGGRRNRLYERALSLKKSEEG